MAAAAGRLEAVLAPLTDLHRPQLTAARRVVGPLLEAVEKRRSAEGLVTFADLLRRAESLLASSPGVRREVVAGIDHLLVDEFQDTDDVQCRLVEALALSGDRERRPSLFIVGDPKQSIYAWRSADLAAYDAFVRKVVNAGGITVDLVRNFRSVTPILDEVERLVAPVMRPEQGIQPPFQRLEATDERRGVPGVDEGPWKTVEHWVAWQLGEDGVGPEKGNSDSQTTALGRLTRTIDVRPDLLQPHWDGEFILLWKPPITGDLFIGRQASQGANAWLRETLARASPESLALEDPTQADWPLQAAVTRFQQIQGLAADGIAGPDTIIRLNSLSERPNIPRIRMPN